MNPNTYRSLLKLLVIFSGIAIVSFVVFKFLIKQGNEEWLPGSSKDLISLEQEDELGRLIAEKLIEQNGDYLLENERVDSVVMIIAQRLTQNLEITDYDYTIKVLDDPAVNAFTIPGGRIYLMRGLLEFADGPEEVAAVLAHEMGHVEQRHVVTKLIREFSLGVIISIATGGDGIMLTELLQSLINSSFSRSHETEADEFALQLMEKSGISPKAMTTFFRKLNREKKSYPEALEFMASHPHNNARIKRSLQYKTSDNFSEKEFDMDWAEVKAML